MDSGHTIFVGFSLTDRVNGLLEECSERDRIYLEDPTYLEKVVIDGQPYVGKQIKNGMAIDRIEDVARSVVSLLTRVNRRWEASSDEASVIAVGEGQGSSSSQSDDSDDEADGFDYSGLVD